jgi:predicted NodU family carbamoyl transferase
MLYTYRARTDKLQAVVHVNGTARIQTVSPESNQNLYKLLIAFKARTGYGILCNTSLNFKGRGFINDIADLSVYAVEHGLDGFVAGGRAYLVRSSSGYQEYLRMPSGEKSIMRRPMNRSRHLMLDDVAGQDHVG